MSISTIVRDVPTVWERVDANMGIFVELYTGIHSCLYFETLLGRGGFFALFKMTMEQQVVATAIKPLLFLAPHDLFFGKVDKWKNAYVQLIKHWTTPAVEVHDFITSVGSVLKALKGYSSGTYSYRDGLSRDAKRRGTYLHEHCGIALMNLGLSILPHGSLLSTFRPGRLSPPSSNCRCDTGWNICIKSNGI